MNLALHRTAALPPDIQISLDPTEDRIFNFIREATKDIPGQPMSRVAGGWVRDKLLGRESKDIDITVEGMKGVQFAAYLKQSAISRYGPQQDIIGTIKDTEARPEQIKNLAVAFLRIFGQDVEILNLRGNEVYEAGNRNPVTTDFDATPEQDAFRRDLTINSLFYNINTGRVEDFTGQGYDDLATMTLRTPLEPQKTFTDDPLRLLRVLRFYSRYTGSQIAPEVIEAMRNPDVQNMITRKMVNPNEEVGIVTERTSEEFRKIMKGGQPQEAIRLMYETGLLGQMLNLPSSFEPLHMDQMNKHHELTLINHTLEVLRNTNTISSEFGLDDNDRMMMNISALFHDLGKLDPRSHTPKSDGARGYSGSGEPNGLTHQQSSTDVWMNFAKAIGMTNNETSFIGDLVADHMNPHAHVEDSGPPSDRQLRRYRRKNEAWLYQYIHAMADSMSKSQNPDQSVTDPYRQNLQRINNLELAPQQGKALDLLNGKEIIDLVGLPAVPPQGLPGYIEVVKERIRDEQDVNPGLTRDQAMSIVQQMVASGEFNAYQQ